MTAVHLPLRVVSVANLREHWSRKAARAREQRNVTMLVVRSRTQRGELPPLPVTVTLVRIARNALDTDNLAGGFKAIRDGVADAYDVDDADPRVAWAYAQERGRRGTYAVRIEIAPRAAS